MNDYPENARDQLQEAFVNRLWWHSVGVVNMQRQIGSLPDGRRGDEEIPGSGSAIKFGRHKFILTAKHVIDRASPNDLRIFCRPSGASIQQKSWAEIAKEGITAFSGSALGGPSAVIRCEWEDLALIAMPEETLPKLNLEFFDLSSWIDPVPGEHVCCFGFPTDTAFVLDTKVIGDKKYETRVTCPPFLVQG